MAKHIILESYTFNKDTRQVTITGKWIRREQLLLITNVTSNTIIYNFSDTSLTASAYVLSNTGNNESTVITLTKDTTSMSSSDKLAILVEETYQEVVPAETFMDPVGKNRVSTPQALIDTDFEYGVQSTKWETVALMNNRPSAFYDPTQGIPANPATVVVGGATGTYQLQGIAATTGTRTVTVYLTNTSGINTVTPIFIQDCIDPNANGWYLPATVTGNINFTYIARGTVSNTVVATTTRSDANTSGTSITVTSATGIAVGQLITGTGISVGTFVQAISGTTVTTSAAITAGQSGNYTFSSVFDPTKTLLFVGQFYTQAGIPLNTTAGVAFSTGSTAVTCTTAYNHGLSVGQAIYITGTTAATSNPPNGAWYVRQTPTSNTFVFDVVTAPTGTISIGAALSSGSVTAGSTTFTATTITSGTIYVGANITGAGITQVTYIVGQITGVTAVASPSYSSGGAAGQATIVLSAGTSIVAGQFVSGTGVPPNTYVVSISSATVTLTQNLSAQAAGTYNFYTPGGTGTYTMSVAATISSSATAYTTGSNSTLYPRTWGTSIHRAYDGGVTFSAGYPYHGNQLIRQTRRFFRYQSGKGIQFSTGSNMCSPLQTDSISSSGSTVTVTTKFPHNIGVGAVITVSGADQSAYNGNFTIATIPTDLTLTYTTSGGVTPSASPATSAGGFTVQPYQWYGANIRVGMFTSQNGFFFEYDGQILSTVKRSSTNQLVGYLNTLTNGTQICLGTNTKWSQQLIPGDFIVIRGMSYTVLDIENDTTMTIYPDYRGSTISSPSQVIISKTSDTKIVQSSWNIDKGDGTGASGMLIDTRKMQMWYMDYSWYGAGAIRWGFKNARGEVIYVNRLAHGNNQTEAYMRSGNMPGRYEVNTFYPKTILGASISNSETSAINVVSTAGFPSAGTLMVTAPGSGQQVNAATTGIVGTGTSTTITGITTGTYGLYPGMVLTKISGTGAFGGTTTIVSVDSQTQITILSATSNTTGAIFFNAAAITEFISYTAKASSTQFTGLTRGVTNLTGPGGLTSGGGTATGTTFTYSATAPVSIAMWYPQSANTISHWGSSVIMDGRYDNDKSLVFLAGMTTSVTNVATNVTVPLISIRIAPSVDSGITGVLGQREIMNSMQLILQGCDVYSTGTAMTFLITLRLNGQVSSGTFAAAGGSSLAQVAYHTAATITGGETVFGFFTTTPGVTTADLTIVREMGNSIVGGGSSYTVPFNNFNKYPDGPDVLTICATNVTSVTTNTLNARLSWTEAQA